VIGKRPVSGIQSLTVALVMRNAFTLLKHTDHIDPEASYGIASQGLELGGLPPVRTVGLNLNLKL
jgi:hypothetical protein